MVLLVCYINITGIINLKILDVDVFSPAGNQHQVNISYFFIISNYIQTIKKKSNFILCR